MVVNFGNAFFLSQLMKVSSHVVHVYGIRVAVLHNIMYDLTHPQV